MFWKIFVFELNIELASIPQYLINIRILFDILQMFQHSRKVVIYDGLFTAHYDSDSNVADIL